MSFIFFFHLCVLSINKSGVLESPTNCVELSISSFAFVSMMVLPFMNPVYSNILEKMAMLWNLWEDGCGRVHHPMQNSHTKTKFFPNASVCKPNCSQEHLWTVVPLFLLCGILWCLFSTFMFMNGLLWDICNKMFLSLKDFILNLILFNTNLNTIISFWLQIAWHFFSHASIYLCFWI